MWRALFDVAQYYVITQQTSVFRLGKDVLKTFSKMFFCLPRRLQYELAWKRLEDVLKTSRTMRYFLRWRRLQRRPGKQEMLVFINDFIKLCNTRVSMVLFWNQFQDFLQCKKGRSQTLNHKFYIFSVSVLCSTH